MKPPGLALLLVTLFTGCVHTTRHQATIPSGLADSHLLYLRSEPHRSLYIEVDAVEGAEFSEAELSRFEAFLSQWCKKPDGVSVVKSSVIPRAAARGHSADWLARRYMDGPTLAAGAAQPAYLYILVYDNRINRNPVQSPREASQWRAADTVPLKLARQESPHVVLYPYPAMIYVDRSWLGGLLPEKYWFGSLIHESGHVLGLVSRESRVEGYHCPTNWCVMNGHVSEGVKTEVMSWLRGEKAKPLLCDDCAAELRQSQSSTGETPMRFVGPALVRKTPLYQVVHLPGFCCLYLDDSLERDLPELMKTFRKIPDHEGLWIGFRASKEMDQESLLQRIEAARRDMEPPVRAAARGLDNHVREWRQERGKNIAEPDGAMNGRQPIASETNPVSPAAGSGR